MYLTDGVFLYRLVGLAPGDAGRSVELEDCYLLDVVRVSIADLRARGLRVVTPAGTGSDTGAPRSVTGAPPGVPA